MARFFRLREQPTLAGRMLAGAICVALVFGLWLFLTWGAKPEDRLVSPAQLPSVGETLRSFHSLWFDRALTRNVFASLERVLLGFGLAIASGVPVGVRCGTWPRISAFFVPVTVFGRNVPISALLPLTLLWFG